MKNKAKLIYHIIVSLLTIAVLITVTRAWYVNTEGVSDMTFDILQIDSLVTVYTGNDDNCNGVLELLSDENQNKYYNKETKSYVAYGSQYYSEKYAYTYHDFKYALSTESQATLLEQISYANVEPTKVYTIKFEITNYINKDNTLSFEFIQNDEINPASIKYFESRIGIVDSTAKVNYTDWKKIVTGDTYTGCELLADAVLPAKTSTPASGRLDLVLQIRLSSDCNQTFTNLQLPRYRITLECEIAATE